MARRANITNWVGLAVATLIFTCVGVGVLVGAQRFIADTRYVTHTNEVIASIDAFEARLRDAESAQRGYLLTDDVDYLVTYQINNEQLQPSLQRLGDLVRDNPVQTARVQEMQKLQAQRLQQINQNLARFRRGGLEEAKAGITRQAFEVSTAMRLLSHELMDHERALLAERATSSQRSALVLRGLAILGIPLGILVLATVYWRLLHEVRRRSEAERLGVHANEQLRESVARLELHSSGLSELNHYSGLLQNCLHGEEAVALTAQLLPKLLPGTAGTLYRIRASRDYAEEVAQWGQHVAPSVPMLPPADCWALRRGQMHLAQVDDAAMRCKHVSNADDDCQAHVACVPLIAQGAQLGFIYISSVAPMSADRLELVHAAAEQLSMALHNIALQERLRVQSIRDPLTGLFNRRYLEESLVRELARCQRRNLPMALMMLDVDHFKAFNDTQGHPGGDALLAALGKLLQTQLRAEDVACRYGGEEFTVLLPEASVEQACQRAEQLLDAIRALRVEHMGHELPAITASIGIAVAGRDSAEQLLQRADQALYQAKRQGRDRAVADARD